MYQTCTTTPTGITWHNKTYTTWLDENQTYITHSNNAQQIHTASYLLLTISEVSHYTAVKYRIKVSPPLI